MGTTSTALRTQAGVVIGLSLVIEGYDTILCSALDTGPVTTAFAGTGWEKALPGLKVHGLLRDAIKPWQDGFNISTLTFEVMPDPLDLFGRAVWKTKPDYRSQMTGIFQAAADGSGTLAVKDAGNMPGSTGIVYVGGKAMKYASKGANSFDVQAAGAQHLYPFTADGSNHFSKPHITPGQQNWDQAPNAWVSDIPTKWIGRKVAFYLHRIVGGVWDTRAQAHLEFAGVIRGIEHGALGATILQCEDLRADLRDCVLLKGQWVGYVRPGIVLNAGEILYVGESDGGHNTVVTLLTVVASGAAGAAQIDAGRYELEDFLARLNSAGVAAAVGLNGRWTFELVSHDGGRRTMVRATGLTSGTINLSLRSNARHILEFLGFTADQITRSSVPAGTRQVRASSDGTDTELAFYSSGPPFRVRPFQKGRNFTERATVHLDDGAAFGSIVDVTDYLPPPYDTHPSAGEVWSFFRVGERLFFGRYVDSTTIDQLTTSLGFAGYAEGEGPDTVNVGLTVDDEGERLDIRQVVILADSFTDIVARIFASTGGTGVNHADYDAFPHAMGCPGIAWSLLGDPFLQSCRRLDQAIKTEAMMVVIDKPTRLVDLFPPEFLLRFAWLVWKDSHYQFASPPLPNALTAEHAFTEANKAALPGQTDMLESRCEITTDFMANVIRLRYNRTPGDKFRDEIVIRDESSISDYGEKESVTLEAPNSYTDVAATGAAAEDLAACLAARTLPMFGRPMKIVRRPMAPTMYHVAPGDTATLTDDRIRDPNTGELGLADRACIVLEASHGYRGGDEDQMQLFGEVALLLTDEERTFPLAPCAEVDTDFSGVVDGITFTDGYANAAAGGPALKVKEHAHSRSTDALDVTQFADLDELRVLEIDPPDPATPDAWDRTCGGTNNVGSYLFLDANISAPAWGGATKLYRVIPQLYSQVVASQKLRTFLADDADGRIEDENQPNLYGEYPQSGAFTRQDATVLPSIIPNEADDEGRPFHAGLLADLAAMGNNLISYKAAPHSPLIWTSRPATVSTDYAWVCTIPFFLGGTAYKNGRRVIKVGARIRILDAAQTASCRVTASRHYPHGDANAPVVFNGAYQQVVFTHTGDTTETTKATQDLLPVGADLQGFTWLTVELKSSSALAFAQLRGLTTLHLGPIE
jgi:hypothetical protein